MCLSSIHGARDPATDGSSFGGILALGVLDEPRCSREVTHFCSLAAERRTLGALRKREYPGRGRRSMADRTVPVVHSDPEIMGGTPVFVGTRVPFQTLLDYLEAGIRSASFSMISRLSAETRPSPPLNTPRTP